MMDMHTLSGIRTPCYVVDEAKLVDNLKLLDAVRREAGCRILLAQKAFSMHAVYPLIARYLDGTTASGLHEARLGYEYFGKETHVFSPAYQVEDFAALLKYADHLIFNSFSQWIQFREQALAAGKTCGLRVNPQRSTHKQTIYDPSTPDSRLGVIRKAFRPDLLTGLSGLHFHCLCEQDADALEQVLAAFEAQFAAFMPLFSCVNFGGGHHFTRPGYQTDRLVRLIRRFRQQYKVDVYLEPGEAVALDAGYLVASVVDVLHHDIDLAILDTSATCHMPDVLEMPYRPRITGAGKPGEKEHLYRLGGPTCLAGDLIGDYSFDQPLSPGDRLVYQDMAIYTLVKNNTFNGMQLPDIMLLERNGALRLVRRFGYEDFRSRLS